MDDWNIASPRKPEGEGGAAMLRRMNASHKPLRDWGFGFLDWKSSMRILDVGCGGGAAIAEMLALSPGSVIDGVDYSADCVRFTETENRDALGSRVFVREAGVSALPFADDTFDLATAIETIYFWPAPVADLREVRRVLKPGGTLAVLCEADGPERMDWSKVNFELTVYRPEELKEMLADAGFQNIRCEVRGDGYLFAAGEKS